MLAISTNEYNNTPLSVRPILKSACVLACVIACVSADCTPITLLKNNGTDNIAVFSTDNAYKADYNGNTCFYWDGISVMSVDRSNSLLRILEIEKLQDNWNENGASSFSKEILNTARNLVLLLSVQPSIFPTARDSIQFEYENELGDYLEFELFDSGRLKMFSYTCNGVEKTKDITIDEMNEVVNDFFE